MTRPYRLGHTNVDGAGTVGYYDTFPEAQQAANEHQETADNHNDNNWGYSYQVFAYGRCVYRTYPRKS